MAAEHSASLLTTLFSGVVSGAIVAALTYWFSRKKTAAEIAKMEAETAKIRQEIGQGVSAVAASVSYGLGNPAEQILYSATDVGFDFEGTPQHVTQRVQGKDVTVGDKAKGSVDFQGDVIDVHRENTEGRFALLLKRYSYNGSTPDSVPEDNLISGLRRIRVTFEAKVSRGHHTLRFVFKNEETGDWLASTERVIAETTWTSVQLFFSMTPRKCRLRIDDINVSEASSNVQIRKLVVAQRTS